MTAFLGLDLGTSGTKALLCGVDGAVLATATCEHPISMPRPGWSEQNPADWWTSAVKATQAVMTQSAIVSKAVKGIGLSGQMHGSVFLNDRREVLRPAILWNDQRTAAECQEIEDRAGGRAHLIQMVSNPAFTGFTAPKILWVRKYEPELFAQVKQVLLPKDYLRLRLTGELATEVSDASGTLLLDVIRRRWCEPLLKALDLDPALLPRCVESATITGQLTADAALTLGLQPGIPVVGGAGDQAAGAVGMGIVAPGLLSAALGTSGVIFAHADRPRTEPGGRVHTMCHAVADAWHLMGVVLSAGGSLQWFRNQFCAEETASAKTRGVDPYDLILESAARAPAGAEGLLFLPYLTGERHPYSDPSARGAWIGLTARHTKAHLARAVVEGISFALRDCLLVMRGLGCTASQIRLSGGGARSPIWRQWLADIFGQPVALTTSTEGPAFGVALLAMVGAGAYSTVPGACTATIRTTEVTDPRPAESSRYEAIHAEYQRLYPLLREVNAHLSQQASA